MRPGCLVRGDYRGLAADGVVSYTDDPDDDTVGEYIEDYPGVLLSLPAEAWKYTDHGPNVNESGSWWVTVALWTAEEGHSDLTMAWSDYGANPGDPGAWWVTVALWTAEEGRSDLTMEAVVWDDGTTIRAQIDLVHVI